MFLGVLSSCWISEYFCHLHALTVVNHKTWSTSRSRYFRHFIELYSSQSFYARRFDLLFVVTLKIVQIAKLTRLTNAFTADKSPMTVKAQTIFN